MPVLYSPERNIAGIVYTRVEEKKTLPGNPPCGTCGGANELIEKYHRYYCRSCRAYVPENKYISEVHSYLFAACDLRTRRIACGPRPSRWTASNPYEQAWASAPSAWIPRGSYLYYANEIHFYRHNRSKAAIFCFTASTSGKGNGSTAVTGSRFRSVFARDRPAPTASTPCPRRT